MGCYGIGPGRIIAAAVEQRHDEAGICWPRSLTPYDVHVVAIGAPGDEASTLAERAGGALEDAGLSVLLDDRDRRPGEKFADADLLGCPLRVTVGRKSLADGQVDVLTRATRAEERVLADAVGERSRTILEALT
jgi:prolyl-tRNA synthetase